MLNYLVHAKYITFKIAPQHLFNKC